MPKAGQGEIKPYILVLSLLTLLLATYMAWSYTERFQRERVISNFNARADDIAFQIQSRFKNYLLALRQAAASIELLGSDISRAQWRDYMAHLAITKSLPGTQGIGVTVFIKPENLEAHERTVQAQGFKDYRVYPQGDRDLYSSIIYLEPFDWRNRRAFGYDMYSEPTRREAMEFARDQDTVAISGRVTLVQETDEDVQQGFLMYAPFYTTSSMDLRLEHRRENIRGYAYSVIRTRDLVDGILGENLSDVFLTIYDQADLGPKGIPLTGPDIHDPMASGQMAQALVSTTRTIDIGGRTWQIKFASTPQFEARMDHDSSKLVAATGIIISLLIIGLTSQLYGQGKRVERRAHVITRELEETSERIKIAQQATKFGVWDLNLNDHSLYWDDLMFEIYGVSKTAIQPDVHFWRNVIVAEDLPLIDNKLKKIEGSRALFEVCFRISTPEGLRHIKAQAIPVPEEDGTKRLVGINLDITEEIIAREKEELAAKVFEFAQEGILITDADAKIIDVNDTFLKITGYDRPDVIGKDPSFLSSGQQDVHFYRDMWRQLARVNYWSGEICNRKKSGEIYYELLHISALKNDMGEIKNYIGIFSDITPLKQHEGELRHLATHDALTGLPNRTYLHARIEQHLEPDALSSGQKLAFLYLDIDHFKSINDTYGHDTGDAYLVEIARRLRSQVHEPHTLARIGGDEFVIIWVYDASTALGSTTHALLECIKKPFNRIDFPEPISLSASIGISIFPEDGEDADTLLRQADQAMYVAKQRGRGGVVHYDLQSDMTIQARMKLFSEIINGLHNNEFELYYQPKVEIKSASPIGFEALIRWHHPTRGLLTPGDFLPETEDDDIAVTIGRWVLETALEQIRTFNAKGIDTPISVNIAARHLSDDGFVTELETFRDQFGQHTLAKLEIEILESYPLANLSTAVDIMERCAALGVTFAIDDFGTGYSSITYLKLLPTNTLKIDKSFIDDMLNDDDDMGIVQGIVEIGSLFNRYIVAEGVETKEQAEALLNIGCEYAQGYYYARPLPARQATSWWQNQVKINTT
jgi:diguanylate cyclase (GGDEF)-like protein/PAS domain S-box-containing protein